jgi:hypothetical protein
LQFNLEGSNLGNTPLPTGIQYELATDDNTFDDPSLYRSAINLLMYAAIATQLDIVYTVNSLSQFNVKPGKVHWNAVKHVIRYLKGTANLGVMYDMCSGSNFATAAFSDSDNGKLWHRKAITGGVILLVGGAIKWTAEKQPIMTLLSPQALSLEVPNG